jgi:hypothetical protein
MSLGTPLECKSITQGDASSWDLTQRFNTLWIGATSFFPEECPIPLTQDEIIVQYADCKE